MKIFSSLIYKFSDCLIIKLQEIFCTTEKKEDFWKLIYEAANKDKILCVKIYFECTYIKNIWK